MKLFQKMYSAFPDDSGLQELKSLNVISEDEAKQMISLVTTKEAIIANASAGIDAEELRKILANSDVSSLSMMRANFTKDSGGDLANKPTIILGVSTSKGTTYFTSNLICPPPDGSVCFDGFK